MTYVVEVELSGGFKSILRNEDDSVKEFTDLAEVQRFFKKGCAFLATMHPTRIRPKRPEDV